MIAKIGPAASGSVALNLSQTIKATATKFQDSVINGDVAVDANGFDGLDKALVGSTTEAGTTAVTDWRDFDSNARAEHKALDAIDEFLSLLDGAPTVMLGNSKVLARVRAAARRAGMYTKNPIDDLLGPDGARSCVSSTATSRSSTRARRPAPTTRSSRSSPAPSAARPPRA